MRSDNRPHSIRILEQGGHNVRDSSKGVVASLCVYAAFAFVVVAVVCCKAHACSTPSKNNKKKSAFVTETITLTPHKWTHQRHSTFAGM